MRPADRDRVAEMSANIWDGHDYVPHVFDDWVADPRATFQAAELDGLVVGIHRLRPIAGGLMYYEGLRVAPTNRRQGIARQLVREGIEESRRLGFRELRLATGNPDAVALFVSEGFELALATRVWSASRLEGGDPPRLVQPGEARLVLERFRDDPALAAYRGLLPDPAGPLDIDAAELERLAEAGQVRQGAGGRSLAIASQLWGFFGVIMMAGSGGALQDLLLAIRSEADSQGLDVRVFAPQPCPVQVEEDLRAVGYDSGIERFDLSFYSLRL